MFLVFEFLCHNDLIYRPWGRAAWSWGANWWKLRRTRKHSTCWTTRLLVTWEQVTDFAQIVSDEVKSCRNIVCSKQWNFLTCFPDDDNWEEEHEKFSSFQKDFPDENGDDLHSDHYGVHEVRKNWDCFGFVTVVHEFLCQESHTGKVSMQNNEKWFSNVSSFHSVTVFLRMLWKKESASWWLMMMRLTTQRLWPSPNVNQYLRYIELWRLWSIILQDDTDTDQCFGSSMFSGVRPMFRCEDVSLSTELVFHSSKSGTESRNHVSCNLYESFPAFNLQMWMICVLLCVFVFNNTDSVCAWQWLIRLLSFPFLSTPWTIVLSLGNVSCAVFSAEGCKPWQPVWTFLSTWFP